MKTVEIIEVGPRDGLQNQSTRLSIEDKIDMICRLYDAGARRIEVASFVNPKRVPQMADAEAVLSALPDFPDLITVGLVLNDAGLDRALQTSVREIGVVATATDAFGLRNQKQTAMVSARQSANMVRRARSEKRRAQATIAVAFGCPFEGEVSLDRVVSIAREIGAAGPLEIALADTIGVAVPAQVKRVIGAVKDAVGDIPLRCHFHNTRNTGIANAWAAFEAGVTKFDASIGGIGGCPFAPDATGNIGTEDLVYMFHRSGIRTNYRFDHLRSLTPWLREHLGLESLPAMTSRAASFGGL